MSETARENDLVLSPNEYAFVLDRTKGNISCAVGPYKMSLSTSDQLVAFNPINKRFEPATYKDAITTFVSAPENWYIVLKNPAENNSHPKAGTANMLPELKIGKKINIPGDCSFALFPGQMAKVIEGHKMHSNQYLLARVYDADALDKEEIEVDGPIGEDGKPSKVKKLVNKYVVGQILVIRGNEVPFYMPPTGIEVLPIGGKGDRYVRDAVTLEKLEYCILKNEKGQKTYVHGDAVVFPEPDQTFVKNGDGGYKFRAIELSEISGVYVKVIADYKENGMEYKTGEELFITGKDQMIYYPRTEHAVIKYDNHTVHHAIAVPAGEGRYVLDRKTGEIKTIKGPKMFLPDPRDEVIVKRVLTRTQCELWYPGNVDVLRFNTGAFGFGLNQNNVDTNCIDMGERIPSMPIGDHLYSTKQNFFGQEDAEVEGGFSRGNHFTKPRTITIDNKFDGAVSIDIWTGYAINVISKNGKRKVVAGPQTYLMEYDETLEILELSTGKPKTTDSLIKTVFLRVENNKVSDIIKAQTSDFIDVEIKVSYCVDFLPEFKSKWFAVENYVKYLTDRERSLLKNVVKHFTIEDFYAHSSEIVQATVLNKWEDNDYSLDALEIITRGISAQLSDNMSKSENVYPGYSHEDKTTETSESNGATENNESRDGMFFEENGMLVHDVEILSVHITNHEVEALMDKHQGEIVRKTLELSRELREYDINEELSKIQKENATLKKEVLMHDAKMEHEISLDKLRKENEIDQMTDSALKKQKLAEKELQTIITDISKVELDRQKSEVEAYKNRISTENALIDERQKSAAAAIKTTMEAFTPDLIAAMQNSSNAELVKELTKNMSPLAIAQNESVTDVTTKLLRGTAIDRIIGNIMNSIKSNVEFVGDKVESFDDESDELNE